MKKKYFTLEEAQKLLPQINIKLNRLIIISKAIKLVDGIEIKYEDDFQYVANELNSRKNKHKLYYKFYLLLEELLNYGAIVKDLNFGLVDFYSTYESKEIFLCWQINEPEIKYWHEADSGYDNRKPIELLKNAQN